MDYKVSINCKEVYIFLTQIRVAAVAYLGRMASTVNGPRQARMGKTGRSTSKYLTARPI